jgi:hypothetical protein
MHLGLIDRPFVPHNLISAQVSPDPISNLQMAPRLNMLMSSGSKKGTKRCFFFSLKKSRQANLFQVPQRGSYGDKILQDIFTYLLTHLSLSLSKVLRKGRPSMFPKSGAPIETEAHYRTLLNISLGVHSKGALPPGPPHEIPSESDASFLEPSFIHHSPAPVYETPLLIPGSPRT